MTIAHEVTGSGPAVVLLHEGVADRRMWRHQVDALRDRWTVVAPDLRGFGETPHASGPFSHVEDVRELLDELAIPSAVVVGGSFGGRVALELAVRAPERITALALLGAGLDEFERSGELDAFDAAEEAALEAGDLDAVSYFISRITIVPTDAPGMARWRKKLFTVIARNAANPVPYFGLPDDRTVVMGSHIEL